MPNSLPNALQHILDPNQPRLAPPDRGPLRIETSVDLKTWTPLFTFPSNSGPFEFIDSAAASHPMRFYRAVKP